MTLRSTWTRALAMTLALVMMLGTASALAQAAQADSEEQAFHSLSWWEKKWAEERETEARAAEAAKAGILDAASPDDVEQGFLSLIAKTMEKRAQRWIDLARSNDLLRDPAQKPGEQPSFLGSLWDKTKEAGSFLAAGARAAGAAITDAWDDVVAPLGF